MKYLIYSKKYSQRDGIAAWWNPNQAGYTTDIKAAGRYNKTEAKQIERESRGNSFAISENWIEKFKTRMIIELSDGDNSATMEELTSAVWSEEAQS